MAEKQWFWMMDYCKKKGIPPAQKWAWKEAKLAYKQAFLHPNFTKKGNNYGI